MNEAKYPSYRACIYVFTCMALHAMLQQVQQCLLGQFPLAGQEGCCSADGLQHIEQYDQRTRRGTTCELLGTHEVYETLVRAGREKAEVIFDFCLWPATEYMLNLSPFQKIQ